MEFRDTQQVATKVQRQYNGRNDPHNCVGGKGLGGKSLEDLGKGSEYTLDGCDQSSNYELEKSLLIIFKFQLKIFPGTLDINVILLMLFHKSLYFLQPYFFMCESPGYIQSLLLALCLVTKSWQYSGC